jgi:hypothetical protein
MVGAAIAAVFSLAMPAPAEAVEQQTRVLRAWDETIQLDGRAVKGRIELVFDYEQGLGFEHVFGPDGNLVERRPGPRIPTPSREEIDVAIDIVTRDPVLGQVIGDLQAYVDGGFILDEAAGRACGPGTRCLQIFAFRRGAGEVPLFRAVVDLTKNRSDAIVYRDSWDQGVRQ